MGKGTIWWFPPEDMTDEEARVEFARICAELDEREEER